MGFLVELETERSLLDLDGLQLEHRSPTRLPVDAVSCTASKRALKERVCCGR